MYLSYHKQLKNANSTSLKQFFNVLEKKHNAVTIIAICPFLNVIYFNFVRLHKNSALLLTKMNIYGMIVLLKEFYLVYKDFNTNL